MENSKKQKFRTVLHFRRRRVYEKLDFKALKIISWFYRPPSKTGEYSGVERNFYNLTMSYKLDSDIGWYYGVIKDLSTNKTVAPALNVQWKDPEKDFNGYGMNNLL